MKGTHRRYMKIENFVQGEYTQPQIHTDQRRFYRQIPSFPEKLGIQARYFQRR